jgi:hypothetical protein
VISQSNHKAYFIIVDIANNIITNIDTVYKYYVHHLISPFINISNSYGLPTTYMWWPLSTVMMVKKSISDMGVPLRLTPLIHC